MLAAFAVAASITAAAAVAAPVGSITEFTTGLSAAQPIGMASGPDGNLWFAQPGTKSIGRITPAGTITEFTAGLSPSTHPNYIATGPDGALWFTDDSVTAPAIGRITTAGTITEFALPAGAFPWQITAGPDGNLWFIDAGSTPAVGRIGPNAPHTITEFTSGLPAGTNPAGITAGPDGNVWFTDEGSTPAIGRITPAGAIHEFTSGISAGTQPLAITSGPDGNLWFSATNDGSLGSHASIGRVTPTGGVTQFTTGIDTGASLDKIAAGPDGNLWFTHNSTSPGIGRITPTGVVDIFTGGIAGNAVNDIAPGADGNLWFTDSHPAIGRIGAGASPASLVAPAVSGSAVAGGPQQCEGDRWATWAGQQPLLDAFAWDGYTWLLDGAQVATGRTYVPASGDIGHALSCKATVSYPLLGTTASATSDAVTVLAKAVAAGPAGSNGSNGSNGASGPQGPQGPQGPAGKVELVTCKTVTKKVRGHKRKSQRCTTHLVNGTVTFTAATSRAKLARHGKVYAAGTARLRAGRMELVLVPRRRLRKGSYTLTLARPHGRATRQTVVIR